MKLNRYALAALRERSGLTQRQLADRCVPPINHSLLARIESGERRATTPVIYRLAEALQVTPLALTDSVAPAAQHPSVPG